MNAFDVRVLFQALCLSDYNVKPNFSRGDRTFAQSEIVFDMKSLAMNLKPLRG